MPHWVMGIGRHIIALAYDHRSIEFVFFSVGNFVKFAPLFSFTSSVVVCVWLSLLPITIKRSQFYLNHEFHYDCCCYCDYYYWWLNIICEIKSSFIFQVVAGKVYGCEYVRAMRLARLIELSVCVLWRCAIGWSE